MKKVNKRIDDSRALLITNATIKHFLFWKKLTVKYSNSKKIKNVFVWYSNLLHMLPTHFQGWRAFLKQVRFDLHYLDGLTSELETYLFEEVKLFNTEINCLLWLPTHMFKH